MKKAVRFWLLATSYQLLAVFAVNAQLMDSASMDTVEPVTSIEAAKSYSGTLFKLVLEKQKFTEFPKEIRDFKNLQYLDLSKNKIKEVPEWIGELTSLQWLILSKNKIETLPHQIGELVNLKDLIMNKDELTSLPPEIGNLKELRYMDLWADNISSFPYQLKNLSNLITLDLRDMTISEAVKSNLHSWLPNTKIFFTPTCACEQ
jgi:Leucine-rich repeat (LRR) protein